MAAYSTGKTGYCTKFAAAYTSARNIEILDTARAVSIVIDLEISVLRT